MKKPQISHFLVQKWKKMQQIENLYFPYSKLK